MHFDPSGEGSYKSPTIVHFEPHRVPSSSSKFKEEKEELEWVLSQPEISRSANLARLLSFVCNKYFDGEANNIREYTIAVEALGRKPSSFDSHADPIVRVTAGALRKKLRELYESEGRGHLLQIMLPIGHYVPEFVRRPDPGAETGHPKESGSEKTLFSRLRLFFNANRSAIGVMLVVVLVVPAIFLAGFFLGRHSDRHLQSARDAFKWGEPVWSDDFDGVAQQGTDPAKWMYEVGNQGGWGNHELETYCSSGGGVPRECDPRHPNAFLDGSGHLVLRAQRNAAGAWTSARITTSGLKNFQYGRIEARMKMPVGNGLWPSFWMLGANFGTAGWPSAGSVDIVENVPLAPRTNGLGPGMIRSTVHGPRYFGGNGLWHDYRFPNGARVDDESFHTYGIIWSPGMVQFYVDDPANIFFVQDANSIPEGGEWVLDHPFYLVMNLAVGGDWPGNPDSTTPSPADLLVDYVRVYKIPNVPAPSIQWQPVKVRAGSAVASIVTLQAQSYSGRVHLTCSVEPATAICSLATSVVNLSDTLSQEDTLNVITDSFTNKGRVVASPGLYKLTITATTISGEHSQLTVPFEVSRGG